jgi:hypothetical protein
MGPFAGVWISADEELGDGGANVAALQAPISNWRLQQRKPVSDQIFEIIRGSTPTTMQLIRS